MTVNAWNPSARLRQPAELMKPIIDPAGWYPADLEGNEDWVYRLNDREIAEIFDAVDAALSKGFDLSKISRDGFPLPTLAPVLADMQTEVMAGRCFALLRGLPIEGRNLAQSAAAFWGIGTYFGDAVSQNGKGHLLGHVKDLGVDYGKARGYMSRAEMYFHSDRADITSLCCMHPAKSGGQHRIASSVTLYNEMLKHRPDLVEALTWRFYKSKNGEIPPHQTTPWCRGAVFTVYEGYFSACGAGASIRKAQGMPGVSPLTALQQEALDVYKAMVKELAVDIDLEQGDISFIANAVSLHSRTEFEDWPEPDRKRHLLRLWLSNRMRPVCDDIDRDIRGVLVDGIELHAPLEAA